MHNSLVVNILGGPGVGKSTIASGVFSVLKMHGLNTEYVQEFAKDLTWVKDFNTLNIQPFVTAEQYRRQCILSDVDVIITDAALLNGCLYIDNEEHKTMIMNLFKEFDTENFVLTRNFQYVDKGRNQSENESIAIDKKVLEILDINNIPYTMIHGGYNAVNIIANDILKRFNKSSIYKMRLEC